MTLREANLLQAQPDSRQTDDEWADAIIIGTPHRDSLDQHGIEGLYRSACSLRPQCVSLAKKLGRYLAALQTLQN